MRLTSFASSNGFGSGCGRGRDKVRETMLVCGVAVTQIWM